MIKGRIIGITGGIGSGKTTVLKTVCERISAYMILADDVGHEVMSPDGSAYVDIVIEFGNEILNADGYIDRKKLGSIVFSDKDKLNKLNSIIHPKVKNEINHRIQDIRNEDANALIFIEAALLIEDHYDKICDELWYIYADNEVRYNRVKDTRNISRERFDSIVNNQLKTGDYKKKCKVVIDNSKDIENTMNQIMIALED